MSVERTICIIGQDGETILGELIIQDGGQAADLNIPRDWFTAEALEDVATACTRMAAVIREYQVTGGA